MWVIFSNNMWASSGFSKQKLLAISNVLDPLAEDPDSFKEYKFTAEDLPEFDRFAVKIIMKQNTTRGPAFVPKLEDFRCIATA